MQTANRLKSAPITGEDLARWLVFTGFWGSSFYLLASVSLIAGARRQPVELDAPTLGVGYGLHVLSFVAVGSVGSAIVSLVRGKGTSEQAEEAIGGGQLERSWPLQAVGGAVGSVVPLALAVASQNIAEQITGRPAILGDVAWPVTGGTMIVLSGLTALAVGRIASWVAEDAKNGSHTRPHR